MITEGSFKILGGSSIIISYLIQGNQRVKERLYPKENSTEIDKHLGWFQSRMKPNSTRLIKMLVQPEKFGDKAPTKEDKAKEL
jgi:hypothetical protein